MARAACYALGEMRLLTAFSLVFVLLTVSAPGASAAIKHGTFAGTSSADDPVSFRVDRRGRVMSFSFDAVSLSCTDGDGVSTPRVVTPRGERFRVRSNRFGIEARNA